MATSTAKTLNQYFEDWLGTDPGSEQNVVRLVESGLPTRVINHLIDRGLTRSEVFDVIIPLRTWKHRKSRRQSLSKEESERAIRTAREVWETLDLGDLHRENCGIRTVQVPG